MAATDDEQIGSVLIMLDNQCLSPCCHFDNSDPNLRTMTASILAQVLECVSHFEPASPGVLFQVGNLRALGTEVREILKEGAAGVICAPMVPSDQEDAGLPVRETQTIVFPSLGDLAMRCHVAQGRTCIVHIRREEIPRMYEVMKHLAPAMGRWRVLLRPRELPLWDVSCVNAYREQLTRMRVLRNHLAPGGAPVDWGFQYGLGCPALRSLVTVGPDGLCYPCPAFYYAGRTHALTTEDLAMGRVFVRNINRTCRLCRSHSCARCLFWELRYARGQVTPCDISSIEIAPDVPRTAADRLRSSIRRLKDAVPAKCRRHALTAKERVCMWLRKPRTMPAYYRLIHSRGVLYGVRSLGAVRENPVISYSHQYTSGIRQGLPILRRLNNVWLVPQMNAAYNEKGELILLSLKQSSSLLYAPGNHDLASTIDTHKMTAPLVVEKATFGGQASYTHAGHFLLEAMARLWPLVVPDVMEEVRGTPIVYLPPSFKPHTTNCFMMKLGRMIYEALHIPPGHVHVASHQPAFVQNLIMPEPAMILGCGAYPIHRTLLETAGRELLERHKERRKGEPKKRVYLSRSHLGVRLRKSANEKELEELLRNRGFAIVHPQEIDIVDQIDIWNNAEIIVGAWGSAFHIMLLADVADKRVICLTPGVPQRQYIAIDRLCGVDTVYVQCLRAHPLCVKKGAPRDEIIDMPAAYEAIMKCL